MNKCAHENSLWDDSPCPDCGSRVDIYGNGEDDDRLINCCFPDCGCDGSRLCDAQNGASDASYTTNVEGMWKGKTPSAIKARNHFIALQMKRPKP